MNIVIHRVLKLFKLRYWVLRAARSRYVINKTGLDHNALINISTADCTQIFKELYDEEVLFNEDSVVFRIGQKSMAINIYDSKLNKNDYLFPYLFWYFNWVNYSCETPGKILNLMSTKPGLANEPHAISNRIINLIGSSKLFNAKVLLDLLIVDYNQLLFSTEEYVGGNHLVDNYLALILFSKICGREDCVSYFDKKIFVFLKKYTYFPENNPSYIRILIKKLDFIMRSGADGIGLKKLSTLLSESSQSFGNISFHDIYNAGVFEKTDPGYYHRENHSFYCQKENGLSMFFGTDLDSDAGFKGHDHDCNSLLEVHQNAKQIIGGKGTICYKYNFRRIVNKSDLMASVVRPIDYPKMINVGSFRSIRFSTLNHNSNLDIINKRYTSSTKLGLKNIISMNVDLFDDKVWVRYRSNGPLYLNFYTDFEWAVNSESITCGLVTIEGVVLLRNSPSFIYRGLYRKRISKRIKLCSLGNDLKIKINV